MADKIIQNFEALTDGLQSLADSLQSSNIVDTIEKLDQSLNTLTDGIYTQTKKITRERLNSMSEGVNKIIESLSSKLEPPKKYTTSEDFAKKIMGEGYDMEQLKVKVADESQLDMIQFLIEEYDKLKYKLMEMNDVFDSGVEHADILSQSIYEGIEKTIDSIENLPGGQTLSKIFKLDSLKEEIQTKIGDQVSKVLVGAEANFQSFGKVAVAALRGIGVALWALATNPLTWVFVGIGILLGSILFLVKQIWDIFTGMSERATEFRKQTGLASNQVGELKYQLEATGLSLAGMGAEIEDVYGAAGALSEEFGNLGIITGQNAGQIALLKTRLGLSVEEGAKLLMIFSGMEGSGQNVLDTLEQTVGNLATAANVAPGAVMKDIAQNSEFIYTYFKGNTREIARAAVNARKLGLNMSNVASITESIMDFESSIEKELQASILLGRSINFNRARQMAFNGDIEGATNEVLRQIGGLEEFDRMNFAQKKAIAEAAGLEVGQLREQLVLQKKIAEDPSFTKKQEEYENNLESIEQMKASWTAISAKLQTALLPVVEAIEPIIKQIADSMLSLTESTFFNNLVEKIKEIKWDKVGEDIAGLISKVEIYAEKILDFIDKIVFGLNLFTTGIKAIGTGLTSIAPGTGYAGIFKTFQDNAKDNIAKEKMDLADKALEYSKKIKSGEIKPDISFDQFIGKVELKKDEKELSKTIIDNSGQLKDISNELKADTPDKQTKTKVVPLNYQQTEQKDLEKQKINFDEIFSPDKNRSMEEKLDMTNKLLYELLNKDGNVYLDATRVGYVLGGKSNL